MRRLDDYLLYFLLVDVIENEGLFVIEKFNFKDNWAKIEQNEVPQIVLTNYENGEKLVYFNSLGIWCVKNKYINNEYISIYESLAEFIKKLYLTIEGCCDEIPKKK